MFCLHTFVDCSRQAHCNLIWKSSATMNVNEENGFLDLCEEDNMDDEYFLLIQQSWEKGESDDSLIQQIINYEGTLPLLESKRDNMRLIKMYLDSVLLNSTFDSQLAESRAHVISLMLCPDSPQYELIILLTIVQICLAKNLNLSQIDMFLKIMENGCVVSSYVASFWSSGRDQNGLMLDSIEDRLNAIQTCIDSISELTSVEEMDSLMCEYFETILDA